MGRRTNEPQVILAMICRTNEPRDYWFVDPMGLASVGLQSVGPMHCRTNGGTNESYDQWVVVPVRRTAITHWGRVTHICVNKFTIIGSDNGLSPGRRQAIIWTNDGILLIGPLGTNFSEILVGIQTFSFRKMHLKISSAKWRSFGLGLNVIKYKPCPGMSVEIMGVHVL